MLRKSIGLFLVLAAAIGVSVAHGGLVVNTTAPTSTIITHATKASFTRTFSDTGNIQARGQSFLMPDTGDASILDFQLHSTNPIGTVFLVW